MAWVVYKARQDLKGSKVTKVLPVCQRGESLTSGGEALPAQQEQESV